MPAVVAPVLPLAKCQTDYENNHELVVKIG